MLVVVVARDEFNWRISSLTSSSLDADDSEMRRLLILSVVNLYLFVGCFGCAYLLDCSTHECKMRLASAANSIGRNTKELRNFEVVKGETSW